MHSKNITNFFTSSSNSSSSFDSSSTFSNSVCLFPTFSPPTIPPSSLLDNNDRERLSLEINLLPPSSKTIKNNLNNSEWLVRLIDISSSTSSNNSEGKKKKKRRLNEIDRSSSSTISSSLTPVAHSSNYGEIELFDGALSYNPSNNNNIRNSSPSCSKTSTKQPQQSSFSSFFAPRSSSHIPSSSSSSTNLGGFAQLLSQNGSSSIINLDEDEEDIMAPPSLSSFLNQPKQVQLPSKDPVKKKDKDKDLEKEKAKKIEKVKEKKKISTSPTSTSSSSNIYLDHILNSCPSVLPPEDFDGIEEVCLNAGGCSEGLQVFYEEVLGGTSQNISEENEMEDIDNKEKEKKENVISITLLFSDYTSSLKSTLNKYCTPSTVCTRWYCACERTNRLAKLSVSLIGVLISTETSQGEYVYFLPLSDCNFIQDNDDERDTSSSFGSTTESISSTFLGPFLPIDCSTSRKERWKILRDILYDPHIVKIIYNSQLSLLILYHGLREVLNEQRVLIPNLFDPKVASYVLDSNVEEKDMELDTLFLYYRVEGYEFDEVESKEDRKEREKEEKEYENQLNKRIENENYLIKKLKKNQIILKKREKLKNYQLNIVKKIKLSYGKLTKLIVITSKNLSSIILLYKIILNKLKYFNIYHIFSRIEMYLTQILSNYEYNGLKISIKDYEKLLEKIKIKLEKLKKKIFSIINEEINLESNEQVSNLLYNKLKINTKNIKKNKNYYSTSEEDLLKIKDSHIVIPEILSYRSLFKFKSTYLDGISQFFLNIKKFQRDFNNKTLKLLDKNNEIVVERRNNNKRIEEYCKIREEMEENPLENFKIHAYWNQISVRTGRLSCHHPNLQSIPSNKIIEGGDYRLRSIFYGQTSSSYLISADYSQIEIRILAFLSKDQLLLELFNRNEDIYLNLASSILKKETKLINSNERNIFKTICLGIIYGMSSFSIAKKLNLSYSEANSFSTSFFSTFNGVKKWIEEIKERVLACGYSTTMIGRRRYLYIDQTSDSTSSSISSPSASTYTSAQKALLERQAVNSTIQGSASEVIKLAMILSVDSLFLWYNEDKDLIYDEEEMEKNKKKTDEELLKLNYKYYKGLNIMQIHDELLFSLPNYTPKKLIPIFIEKIKKIMERKVPDFFHIKVPLLVNIKVGNSWGDLESYELEERGERKDKEEHEIIIEIEDDLHEFAEKSIDLEDIQEFEEDLVELHSHEKNDKIVNDIVNVNEKKLDIAIVDELKEDKYDDNFIIDEDLANELLED